MLYYYPLAAVWHVLAVTAHPASRSEPSWPAGFQDPPAVSRAKFRYWLPDASADVNIVKADIQSAGSIGAGGVEFLPFYNYGGELPEYPAGADWSTYGFGTPAFKKVFRAALEAHSQNGLLMDFALGPNQGQGVPAEEDDDGLQWDLVPFKATLPSNGSWRAVAPGWGTGRLVSLVSASVVSTRNLSFEAMDQLSPVTVTYEQLILRDGSFVDHTSQVLDTGHVDLDFDPRSNISLFAFYEKHSHRKALEFPSNGSASIFDHGAYIVDHFSARGAQTVTDFWEEHILDSDTEDLLRTSGQYSWEDSAEVRSNISWTPSLPSKFWDKFGYSLSLNLPLLSFRQNNVGLQPSRPGAFECLLDTHDQGVGVSNDFRSLLGAAYTEYLDALRQWTNTRLSLGFRTQPGYNLPVDMMATIPHVDVPECESLGFRDSIDAYRQFSGPAQVSGRNIVSNELGAVFNEAWRYTLSTLTFSANRAFAGGINRMVLHGQGYTGNYYQTTWPGYVAFNHIVSETWTNKQPAWGHGMSHVMDYLARVQHILQNGVAKADVAIYHKRTATNFTDVYTSKDLNDAGWSYNYLTSESLDLPNSKVEDGVLSPSGPAYAAFVVPADQNLTLSAVRRLQNFAAAGLPVIFSGDSSQAWYSSAGAETQEELQAGLKSLLSSENVHAVQVSGVAEKLSSLGLIPRARSVTNGTWQTTWTQATDDDFVFVFCDSELSNTSGIGRYTANFAWPPASGRADGAYISLPPIHHALLLRVNGEEIPPLDHARPVADISRHLVEGDNEVEITAPTTLWNYIRTMARSIETSGTPPVPAYLEENMGIPMDGPVENGLTGPVVLIPTMFVKV
ncbi:hypothetical protein ACHAQH_006094 [Verticillium albo-atrum]